MNKSNNDNQQIDDIKENIRDIKENHLAHIEPDVAVVKTDLAVVKTNVEWLMKYHWIVATASIGSLIASIINMANH